MEKPDRDALCWCGSGKAYKDCHCDIDEKIESYRRRGALVPTRDMLKNEAQIEGIRQSARINTAVLDEVASRHPRRNHYAGYRPLGV